MALPPVVGLEIGTTKVVALVGEMREDGSVMVTGLGERPSAGVRKGEVVDIENAVVSVRAALQMAEESGKVMIRDVVLAASGGHIAGTVNRGAVPVSDPGGTITEEDIDQAMNVARAVNLPPEHEVLHTVCQHFCIDSQERVIKPEGMEGAKLSLDMLVIHGVRGRLHNLLRVAHNVPIDVEDVAFSGLCSALAVLTGEQKKGGAVVIDLGGGCTDYLAYAGNVMAAAGALGLGGDHVTNDIAMAFNIATSQAETLKRENGSAEIRSFEAPQKVAVPPEVGFGGATVNLKALDTVIHARMDEILTTVRRRLESRRILHHIGAGVVVTGGGAHLRGVTALAERIFGLPCTVGRPRNLSGLALATEGPEYATASGLVQYGFRAKQGANRASGFTQFVRRLLGRR